MNIQRCIIANTVADFLAIAHFIKQQHGIAPSANYNLYSTSGTLVTTDLISQLDTIIPTNYSVITSFNDSATTTVFTTQHNLQWVQQHVKLCAVLIVASTNSIITSAVLFVPTTNSNISELANVLNAAIKINVIALAKGNSDFEVMQTVHTITPYLDAFRVQNRACFGEIIKNEHSFKTCEEIISYYSQKVNSNFVILSKTSNLNIELLLNKSLHVLI